MASRAIFTAAITTVMFLAAACAQSSPRSGEMAGTKPAMGEMATMVETGRLAPPVKGYYKGQEILFIHTEASDRKVAEMLTTMMGPQVVLVPALAQAPESVLGKVYVFANGVPGGGPFGYQPDVFASVPGDPSYTPLQSVKLVAWKDGASPRELRSVEEVQSAQSKGEITIEVPGVVVNMPILTWPGGHR